MHDKADSVEAALTADPVFDALLRQIAAAPVPPSEPSESFGLPVEVGAQLGAFTVLEVIGRGGSAVVYRGRDERLGRDVALKVLWRKPVDAGRSDPLLAEARTIASLADPRVASVYEVGEAMGRTFIAMELVRGMSLRRYLDGSAPGTRDAVGLAREIALALRCIHANGLVHRDLKPENIALAPSGGVKVLDFGIAKARGSSPSRTAGTPDYMAPEQRRKDPVDARADVYAFGVVLGEIIGLRCGKAGPSVFAATDTRRDDKLRRLVADCVADAPGRRPKDGADLVQRLERIASGRSRHGLWIGGIAAMVGVGLVSWAGSASFLSPAPPRVQSSIRLTGNALGRPIGSPALSASGRHFAYIDRGLVVGPTDRPDDLRRIEFEAPAIHVETIPGTDEWMAVVPSGDQTAIYRMPADGHGEPRRVFRGAFRIAAVNPVDDSLILTTSASLTRVDAAGRERWYKAAPSGIHFCAASWSPDGAKLAVIFSKLERFGRVPCIEVWGADRQQVLFHRCSPRLAQAYLPTVYSWAPNGALVFAESDPPGQDRGASVFALSFDAHGRARADLVRLAHFEQSLGGVALSADGRLLTLREQISLVPTVARIEGDALVRARRLDGSQLDARLAAWDGRGALYKLAYRAGVPRIVRVNVADAAQVRPPLPGWAQTWPVPVGGGVGTLFWYAERPFGDRAPEWRLARWRGDSVLPVDLPERPREHVAAAVTPPTTLVVRCASSRPLCVLGAPEGEDYAFHRLSLDGGSPTRLFSIPDFHTLVGVWQISPDGSELFVVDRHRTLATYSLAGQRREARSIEGLQRVRHLTVAPDSGVIYMSGVAADRFSILRLDGDREVVIAEHSAVMFLDLLAAPQGRLAYVKKSIDTDLWLTLLGGG